MPIFNSDISAENFLNTIRIGQFPSDALKTYGFGNPGALANVRYRASIYEWGLKRSLNLPGDLVDFGAYHGLFPFLFHSSHDIALFGKQHHLFDAWGGANGMILLIIRQFKLTMAGQQILDTEMIFTHRLNKDLSPIGL